MFNMRFPDGRKKAVTLSYDDGLYDDLRLMELLHRHGMKATFNISSDIWRREDEAVGGPWPRMTEQEAVDAFRKYSKFEVAVHGLQHRNFASLSDPELYYEISADRAGLEKRFQRIVKGCAYPYGGWNAQAITALKNCGIKYARTCGNTPDFRLPDNWLAWGATCHHNYEGLSGLVDAFIDNDYPDCRLFYLWGHTAEFRRDNNWEVVEDFCERLAGRDFWYATNLEIVEYTEAYRALEYSVSPNSDIAHNPSAIPVWVEDNGEVFCINPGETIRR